MTSMLTRFADEPLASDSAQFPLARPARAPESTAEPSQVGVRPWGLRGMTELSGTSRVVGVWQYDHERQVAVDGDGRPLAEVMAEPTAGSVTGNDGDEGPSEDYVYDFAPDAPQPV
ncbi:putative ATP-grasp-modified RiPP [Saccharopolyspora phatthalungensis]|uniref:Putative ATP-grasp target RiPP n=1 Tax=Saccharopolyspora phatthalungensis TaxID=664693 RepID=A0A840QAE7_9PSEU|nr:putative ATP-grasp-modified RiPP [Saccharopolyspora phatthalungensis]MBB5156731.1 putative ATP-grasp target RiPP [Saccharopolyspora phatthalungensis]